MNLDDSRDFEDIKKLILKRRESLEKEYDTDINIFTLFKEGEVYVFFYDDLRRENTKSASGRYACNLELSFGWYDSAVLCQKLRQEVRREYREKSKLNLKRRFEMRGK